MAAELTVKQALAHIKKAYSGKVVVECLEFPSFYAFALRDEGRENDEFAGGYDTVYKTTGEIGVFLPTEDLDAYMNAKTIELN